MVKTRLSLNDVKEKGWLLDGYPRSFAQAQSLEDLNIRPDVFIMLDVRVILAKNVSFFKYSKIGLYVNFT